MSEISTYAANDQARALGNPKLEFTHLMGTTGAFKATMPDGEILTGRYSLLQGGAVGFGSLYATAYGSGGFASGSAFSNTSMFSMTNPAVADAQGPKSTIHCEVMNSIGAHGNGVCETDKGARYRVQY